MSNAHDWLPEHESDAFAVARAMEEKYGWRVRITTRGDAETAYEGSDAEGEFTDEEWVRLRTSREWREISEMSTDDWDRIHEIVYDVLGHTDERKAAAL